MQSSTMELSNSVNYSINHNHNNSAYGDFKNVEINHMNYSFSQIHENDEAAIVILNEPSLAQWMGSIHPNGSLYEEPLDLSKAQEEHRQFRRLLEKEGCIVKTVREILTSGTGDIAKRVLLEDFAAKCMKYELDSAQKLEELGVKDKELLSDDYKKKCIDSMSVEQLVEVILTRPTIKLRKSERDTELLATEYSFQPLVNLVFQRDQQITTAKGIVMASLSSPIRAPETELMKLCFKLLNLPVIGEIPNPGKLEGGDYYPGGRDLCFIGVGLRSNFYAVDYLMRNDLLGTNRVAVVKDYFDLNQQRMHLDTVCNIINERVMLILEDICGEQSPIRRLVDEYTRSPSTGVYHLTRNDIEFSQYLKEQGFELVYASDQNQKDYGCNGLNIGRGKFIVVDQATAKTIARALKSAVKLLYVDFRTVTKMYGSVHCCSQVVSRRSPLSILSPGGSVPSSIPSTPAQQAAASGLGASMGMLRREDSSSTPLNHAISRSSISRQAISQTPCRVLMVAPTYFINAKVGSELINASVVRDTRHRVLEEYANLHQQLRSQGVDIHLFCHEPYHKTPSAVFVGKWFSTHSAAELDCDTDTLVLYPLASEEKQRQRRREMLEHGVNHYGRVIDLTSCEHGVIQANETTIPDVLSTISTISNPSTGYYNNNNNNNNHNNKHLEFSNLVLDRLNRVAFCAVGSKGSCEEVADLWAKSLGYTLVKLQTQEPITQALFIGTRFAVLCRDALSSNDAKIVEEHLKKANKSVVIISRAQMSMACTMLAEVSNTTGDKTVLVMTKTCQDQFTPEQIQVLEQSVDKHIAINMSSYEDNGGNGITFILAGLF